MAQYLAQIKDIVDKFNAIGEPLSYRDHLGYILKGLGNEYYPFVTTIQNRTDRPSIADVCNLLIIYEVCLEKQIATNLLNLIQANLANVLFGQTSCKNSYRKTSLYFNSPPNFQNPCVFLAPSNFSRVLETPAPFQTISRP